MSLVNRSIKEKGRYSSGTIMMPGSRLETKCYHTDKVARYV